MNRTPVSSAMLLLIGTVGVLTLTTVLAPAPARAGTDDPAGSDDPQAVALLSRAAVALHRTSYTGTRVVSTWGGDYSATVLVDVKHVAGQGTLLSMRGGGVDDDTAAFLAAGDGDSPQRPEFGVDSLVLLTRSYDVWTAERGQVAGRPSRVVAIGRDGSVVARIWVDEASGLPLRREVFDAGGRLAVESAFIDLTVDDESFISHLPPSRPDEEAQQVGRDQLPELQSRGYACPSTVGTLQLVDIERVASSKALHMSYSDGLSRVSVFEQRGSLDAAAVEGYERTEIRGAEVYVREGMPSYAVWESHGTVYTVVSDAPLDTIGAVVRSYPHEADPQPGFWGRVGGGFARMGAWVTPVL
ncbi:MAG: hypothetical protein GEU96_16880 [Propionibacteriales bacterium]|nr:hypothetical protein [Propionibacteriales bacterium]